MNRIYLFVCLLTLGLVLGLAQLPIVPAFAQNSVAVLQPQSTPASDDANKAIIFEGQITQANGKYVLRDSAGKVSYLLDDQDKAKEYDGKSVKVTGTLDPTSNTIHIVEIEAA